MFCCPACIDDAGLSKEIFPIISTDSGQCNYCGEQSDDLVCPMALRDRFEFILAAYQPNDDGRPLAEWLKNDWLMFPKLDVANTMRLLGDILDDGNLASIICSPLVDDETDKLLGWNALREELLHENRFFPKTNLDTDRLQQLLSHIFVRSEDVPEEWYRVRIQENEQPFKIAEMGAPPKRKTTHGRANPAGIPYLYVASDKLTAISEIRPHTGQKVNVGTFTLAADLKFVDVRNPRKQVSPFLLSDENEVSLLRRDISFLEQLGNELKRPVLPQGAAIDYIPSQYLCEFIKTCHYNGVIYNSSVGEGMNLALFDPANASGKTDIDVVNVTRVAVEIS